MRAKTTPQRSKRKKAKTHQTPADTSPTLLMATRNLINIVSDKPTVLSWEEIARDAQARLAERETELERARHIIRRYGTGLLVIAAMLVWALWKAVTG
jgi:hypothetical protein